jgi:hypothetical protein
VTGAAGTRPDDLSRRRRVLLVTMTVLRFRYPESAEPAMVRLLRGWLGILETVAMKMTGQRANAIFKRYAIVDEGMLWEAEDELAALASGGK